MPSVAPVSALVRSTGHLRVIDGPKFSALPHAILYDERLTNGEVVLYAALQAHWWQGGECWASHGTLARAARCSERQVQRYLRRLVTFGYIVERRRGQGQAKAYSPVEHDTGVALNTTPTSPSAPNTTPVSPQHDTGVALNTTPVSDRRRRIEEDSPKEEDTIAFGAADATPEPAKPKATKERSKATLAPETFDLEERHIAYAAGLGFDEAAARRETDKFLAHHRFKGTRGVDWYAGWQNWMRRAVQYGAETQQKQRPSMPGVTYPTLGSNGTRRHVEVREF
jgi:hypothetical protein